MWTKPQRIGTSLLTLFLLLLLALAAGPSPATEPESTLVAQAAPDFRLFWRLGFDATFSPKSATHGVCCAQKRI